MDSVTSIDYYGIEGLLSEREKAVRGRVRRLVDTEVMPTIADYFDRGAFPMDVIPRMAGMGLFGFHVDGYGCKKENHVTYGLVCQELGRCDSGLRAMFSVQNSLVMYPLAVYGSEEQKNKWLPPMAAGEAIGCFCLSEPGFGSNPSGMSTRAEKRGREYVISGTKLWITNGTIASLALVWAKTEEGIRGFLVERGTPGFRSSPIKRKFAYRTSPTALLEFKECAVPEENLLPLAQGLKPILTCLNLARYGVACGALGSAIACYEAALSFAGERVVFEKPIASYQLVQDRLVRMVVEITKAQLLSYHLGRLMDQGMARHTQISLAKMNHVREAMKIARAARDLLGARGILADHHVMRHLCDLEAVSALEGTENIHTLILGNDLTGISAFS